jgi:NAD(P)-dependent dehydrogenase (short-subunit alcohol dehydrogenase family)
MPAYTSSKWAVEALSKSTAQAIRATGLHGRMLCVPLAPGVISSEMNTMPWAKPVAVWAPVAARRILSITPDESGSSLTLAREGFYSQEYEATWAIPDRLPLPARVEIPK